MLLQQVFHFVLLLKIGSFGSAYEINIDDTAPFKMVDRKFLSLAISAGSFNKTGDRFRYDFSSIKLRNILRALRPSFVRIGGTRADFIRFVPDDFKEKIKKNGVDDKKMPLIEKKLYKSHKEKKQALYDTMQIYNVSIGMFHKVYDFVNSVNSTPIWDINAFFRDPLTYEWDPTNFQLLLKHIGGSDYKITWQLGNEANRYKKFMDNPVLMFNGKSRYPTVTTVARDYTKLRTVLTNFGRNSDIIVGPEVTQPKAQGNVLGFIKSFLSVDGVSDAVDVISFHHYYVNGRNASLKDFLDPDILDSLEDKINTMVTVSAPKDVWMTETGSAWGGGAPYLSNRYVAGFLLLDKLGLSAINGIKVVIRQAFLSGNYAMVNSKERVYFPHPDFYVSVLFKRLVGTKVLTTTSSSGDRKFRVYTHCSRGSSDKYSKYVTAYILNLYNSEKKFMFKWAQKKKVDQFLLTPGTKGDLQSDSVKLNGEILSMDGDDLPRMNGKEVSQPITIPAQSFGFFVVKKEYPECP